MLFYINIIEELNYKVLICVYKMRFYYPGREDKDKVNKGENSWDQTKKPGKIICQLFNLHFVFFASWCIQQCAPESQKGE